MNIRYLAFSDRGEALANKLATETGGSVDRCPKGGLQEWTNRNFTQAAALVYVGSVGIAVRAIAPPIQSKVVDPAVVVIDETGHYIVPVLSGHLGGANDLAKELSECTGGIAVITTATDRNGLFAVDEWAKRHGCTVANPDMIKHVSGKLVNGDDVIYYSDFPIEGAVPEGLKKGTREECDFQVSLNKIYTHATSLHLVPRVLVAGIGCKRGTPEEAIDTLFQEVLEQLHISELAVCKVCSIDLKANEPGLQRFAYHHGLEFQTFSAEELNKVEGAFSASFFVKNTTGVDNVCERSAVLGSGGGELLLPKTAKNGVTVALASLPVTLDWRWLK